MLFRKHNPEDEGIERTAKELLRILKAREERTETEGWMEEETETFIENDLNDAPIQESGQEANNPATLKKENKGQLTERMPKTQKNRKDELPEETDNFDTWEQLNALAQTLTNYAGEETETFIENDLNDAPIQESGQEANNPATLKKENKGQLTERMPKTQKNRKDELPEETDNFDTWEQLNALAQTLTNLTD